MRCDSERNRAQVGPVVVGAVRRFRAYRNNRPQMSWPQAPEMEIAELVAIAFNRLPQISAMRRSGFMSSKIDPVSRIKPYDQLAITQAPMIPASGSIQSHSKAREKQADNHQHRHRRIGDHVDYSGAHIVVAVRRSVRVFMLVKNAG
jgi:hypothetical protein